jgi:hypothetical protein
MFLHDLYLNHCPQTIFDLNVFGGSVAGMCLENLDEMIPQNALIS